MTTILAVLRNCWSHSWTLRRNEPQPRYLHAITRTRRFSMTNWNVFMPRCGSVRAAQIRFRLREITFCARLRAKASLSCARALEPFGHFSMYAVIAVPAFVRWLRDTSQDASNAAITVGPMAWTAD